LSDAIGYPAQFRVDDDKVRRYLLDPNHVDGGAKCTFLLSVGFTLDDPVTLMTALIAHPSPQTLVRAYAVLHGLRYHFEGPMRCPGGDTANVRTVWQIDARSGLHPARFITLKPLRKLRVGS
jgi:hypothetical protein